MALSSSSTTGSSQRYQTQQSSTSGGYTVPTDYYASTQHLTQRHARTFAHDQYVAKQAPVSVDHDDKKYTKSPSPKMWNSVLVLMALTSFVLVGWGYYLAFHTHPVQTIFRCEPSGCTYRETHDNGDHSVLHLMRHQIKRTELVRLDRKTKQVVQYLTGPRKNNVKNTRTHPVDSIVTSKRPSMFDYCKDTYVTYSLVFDDEEDHYTDLYNEFKTHSREYLMVPHSKDASDRTSTIIFTNLDLTDAHLDVSNPQRSAYNHLKHYIAAKRTHVRLEELHYDGTVGGIQLITAGVVLFCVVLVAWQWMLFKNGQWSRSTSATTGTVTMGDHHVDEDDDDEDYEFSDASDDETSVHDESEADNDLHHK